MRQRHTGGVHACFSVLESESTSKEYTLVPCKRKLNGMSVISYEVRVVLSEVNMKVPLINFFLGILNNGNPEREEVLDHLDDIANSSLGIKGTLPLLASAGYPFPDKLEGNKTSEIIEELGYPIKGLFRGVRDPRSLWKVLGNFHLPLSSRAWDKGINESMYRIYKILIEGGYTDIGFWFEPTETIHLERPTFIMVVPSEGYKISKSIGNSNIDLTRYDKLVPTLITAYVNGGVVPRNSFWSTDHRNGIIK